MNGEAPKYALVRQALAERVGALEVGVRLPSEPELCAEFAVSRITLRHAVDGLIASGMLRREQGRGTFVAGTAARFRYPERFADKITGFYGQQRAEGNSVTSVIDGQRVERAGSAVATALGLEAGEPVVVLERRRSVNGALHHHAVSYVSADRLPAVADHDFTDASLLLFIQAMYGVEVERNDIVVSLGVPPLRVAELIGLELGETALVATTTLFDRRGPIVYGTAHFTPNSSQLAFGLSIHPG